MINNKLNVTYISSTGNEPVLKTGAVAYNPITRVMTGILNSQKELNVTYSDIPVKLLLLGKELPMEHYGLHPSVMKEVFQNLVNTIKDEIVLLSIMGDPEIEFLRFLLLNNKKVVIGGTFVKFHSLNTLREIFKINNLPNLHNLLIVRPYIDAQTNLYDIIINWKDIDKYPNDRKVYNCTGIDDYFLDYVPILKRNGININILNTSFQNRCSWGKCTFCDISSSPIDFIDDNNIELFANNLITLAKKYNVHYIGMTDPEFFFTKKHIKILNILEQSDYKIEICILSSIRLLLNDKYFDYIFKRYKDLIISVSIGVETLSDFALKLLNKGHTVSDYYFIINKIIKYYPTLNRPILIRQFMVYDICNKNKNEIIKDYESQLAAQETLKANNIWNTFATGRFIPLINSKYVLDNPYIKLINHPLSLCRDYIRLDIDGNELPIDQKFVDPTLFYNVQLNKESIFDYKR